MTANDAESVQALLAAGKAQAVVDTLEPGDVGALAGLVPAGYSYQVEAYDLRYLADKPDRRKGIVNVTTVASFLDYWRKHKEPTSEIYADVQAAADTHITAVMNASGGTDDLAAWRDHRCVLTLKRSPEWAAWTAYNGKLVAQAAFAEFIETWASYIIGPEHPRGEDVPGTYPDAATMLEVAQSIQGHKNTEWKSATRNRDGNTSFGVSSQASAGAGRDGLLEIPTEFAVLLRPWAGHPLAVLVVARLKYRITDQGLALGYVLVDLDRHLEDAAEALTKHVRAEVGEGPLVLLGTP